MKKHILTGLLAAVFCTVYAQPVAKNRLRENSILIANEKSHVINLAKLTDDPVLRMPIANKDYHIVSYRISYLSKEKVNHLWGPFFIKGDNMNKGNAAVILGKAQPGDKIFFEDIMAESNDAGKHPIKLSAAITIQ